MKLKTPELVWLNPKAPYSQEYTDRYYSEGSPEDECRHVYLAANGLPDRWIKSTEKRFLIAEIGFGFGLNFILSALIDAHQQGVIHCDLKPDNVLINGEETLITDFGFAKELRMAAITADETMLGTPSYMSPEQFRGVRTDPRSDLYAAGAVLYHMATGSPPYGTPSQAIRFLAGDERVPIELSLIHI